MENAAFPFTWRDPRKTSRLEVAHPGAVCGLEASARPAATLATPCHASVVMPVQTPAIQKFSITWHTAQSRGGVPAGIKADFSGDIRSRGASGADAVQGTEARGGYPVRTSGRQVVQGPAWIVKNDGGFQLPGRQFCKFCRRCRFFLPGTT